MAGFSLDGGGLPAQSNLKKEWGYGWSEQGQQAGAGSVKTPVGRDLGMGQFTMPKDPKVTDPGMAFNPQQAQQNMADIAAGKIQRFQTPEQQYAQFASSVGANQPQFLSSGRRGPAPRGGGYVGDAGFRMESRHGPLGTARSGERDPARGYDPLAWMFAPQDAGPGDLPYKSSSGSAGGPYRREASREAYRAAFAGGQGTFGNQG